MNKDELKTIAKKLVGRYAKKELSEGYQPVALHIYDDNLGNPLYIRPRLQHPDGRKWIRPFHIDPATQDWILGEPKFSAGKPLYHLGVLAQNPHTNVWVVEGEQKADCLEQFGFTATTSGGSSTASSVDWEPLRGRNIIVWRDFDEAGFKYAQEIIKILESLNCTIHCIDVEALNLPDGGDIVDWLKRTQDYFLSRYYAHRLEKQKFHLS